MFFFPEPDHDQIQDRVSKIFLKKKVTIILAGNPQTSKRISLIQILYVQGKQVFPNNTFEEETELEDHDDYISPNEKLPKKQFPNIPDEEFKMRTVPYQEAVGRLFFADKVSRPDINFVISYVSRFKQNPGKAYWIAVNRFMHYLKRKAHWKFWNSVLGRQTSPKLLD
ncbi:hypothetical protein JTB14_011534 [Gonioctena quinquepunctata]|nr:hypothetical protein JTB14_011534 [Gonioctena quinquepunctata]